MKTRFVQRIIAMLAMLVLNITLAEAQSPVSNQKASAKKLAPAASGAQAPVVGGGTLGKLTKWTGFTGTNSIIGDTNIFEDKFGKVGIGTTTPTSLLTVQGMIETTLGGLKFPDGSLQTTAAINGLSSVFHNATLTGNGTQASPLGVAIPLSLTGAFSNILEVRNTSDQGNGALVIGGNSTSPFSGGTGLQGNGGNGTDTASGGIGLAGLGGNSSNSFGGSGVSGFGGKSDGSNGGDGVSASGGVGSGIGNRGGSGISASGGQGIDGANDGLAGEFIGDVEILGNLSKGGGSFKIDHPLDPENKYLYHSFVESPDMKNIYDGVVRLDSNGEAIVLLPEWFGALNRDFRYLLTAIGAPSPTLYIAQEIADNRFKIAGGTPSMKVSWQVTGTRQDAYANAHRIVVEEDKSKKERGYYLHPDVFGQPEERGIQWTQHPESMRQIKEKREQMKQRAHTGNQ
jgi:hypothetical protein